MIIKILGAIDIVSAIAFLMLVFGLSVFPQYLIFCAGLLFLKGLFIISGDVLSLIDLFSAAVLLLSVFFSAWTFLLWIGAFFLFAKGVVSFL